MKNPGKTAIGFQPIKQSCTRWRIILPLRTSFFSGHFELISGGVMLLIPFWLAGHFAVEELAMIKWAGIQDCAIGDCGLPFTVVLVPETDRKIFLFLMVYHPVIAFTCIILMKSVCWRHGGCTPLILCLHFHLPLFTIWKQLSRRPNIGRDHDKTA